MFVEILLRLLTGLFSLKTAFCLAGLILGSFFMKHVVSYREFYIAIDKWLFSGINSLLGL
jgi:hypothetical protein